VTQPEPWGADPKLDAVLGEQGAEGFRALLDGFPEAVGLLWAIRDAEGRIVGASAIARDITDRKRMEVALRERDTLRYVASLAAAAAHEINNPLAAVMGHTHLLADEVDAKARERIDAITAAASRIAQIVARMRGVTRVELTDEAPYLPEMLDPNKSSERLREHQRL